MVNGKMGMRRTRVSMLAHHLASWLDKHPRRDDPEAALWPACLANGCRVPISCTGINLVVKTAAARAGIRKRVYPYLFRHSRATYLASRLTEAQLSHVLGWRMGSDMPHVYVHLSGRDIDGALLKLAGVEVKEEYQKESVLRPRVCPRCAASCPGTSMFCHRCSAPLDSAEVYKAEEQTVTAGSLIAELLRDDPALQALLKDKIKQKLSSGHSAAVPPSAGHPCS